MIKGYKFPYGFCPVDNCEHFFSKHWLKQHLMFYHGYKYTQKSPNFPVKVGV